MLTLSTWGLTFLAADAGSTYEPYPILKYRWDPKSTASIHRQNSVRSVRDVDLGPHPADPMAQHNRRQDGERLEGPNVLEKMVFGMELYVYSGRSGYVFMACLHTNLAQNSPTFISVLSAHTRFGDSSFGFRFPILR